MAPSPLAPLRNPSFTACWISGTIAHGANWMQTIAVPILVYHMTDSNTWLGIAAVAGQGPAIVGLPLGGAWADRYSKRVILIFTVLVKIAVATSFYVLHGSGSLDPYMIAGLLVVMGLGASINLAAWQPFVVEIVPKRDIAQAYRLNAMQFNVSRAVGPALAGLVIAQFGMETAFLVNACAYAPLLLTLALVRPRRAPVAQREGLVSELAVALRTLLADRGLWVPTLAVAASSLFGQGLYQLMAAIGMEHFDAGEQGVGYLMSSIGVTSVLAAVLVIGLGERVKRSTLVRTGMCIYVVGLLLVAATHEFWVGMAGFALTGIAHVFIHVSSTTAVQVRVDDVLRSRVTAMYLMGILLMIPMGAQIGGLVADLTSLSTVIAGSALGIATSLVMAQLFLRGFRDLDPVEAPR